MFYIYKHYLQSIVTPHIASVKPFPTLNIAFFHNFPHPCYNQDNMPSWNIHLEAGNRLSGKLKLSKSAKQEFLFACLLPDINNGYINKVKTKKHHEETHYAYNQKSSLNFYAENRDKINQRDLIFLGYLFHLYTDGFFNYDFYRTIKRTTKGRKLSRDAKLTIKHHDFWLYDTNFHHQLNYTPKERIYLAKRANKVNATDITPEDIQDVERILADDNLNSSVKGDKYQFYTKKRLDTLLEDMLESFWYDYLEDSDA